MDWKTAVSAALQGDHPKLGRSIVFIIFGLIIFSVISVGVETLPGLPNWLVRGLEIADLFVVAVFSVEFVLRILTAPQKLRYIFSFWGFVDLIAILPFYLSLGLDLRSLRALRILRMFRLLKLVRYSNAADRIGASFRMVREELVVFGLTSFLTLYFCAIGIYYFEHEVQPDKFSSVFDSMWWAAVTLTTVGYGDAYPVTAGGKVFTVLVLFVALGVIAIPTGLVSSALARVRNEETQGDD